MPDDGMLRLTMVIDGTGAIPAAMNNAASAVESASSRMSGSVHGAAASFDEGDRAVNILRGSLEKVPESTGKAEYSVTEARHALRGMGEEMGLHMPRFVSSFVASLGIVGPLLASAFSIVAVIGLVEILMKLPAMIGDAADAMGGFGAEQKKLLEQQVELNRVIGESTAEKLSNEIKINTAEHERLAAVVPRTREAIAEWGRAMDRNEAEGARLQLRLGQLTAAHGNLDAEQKHTIATAHLHLAVLKAEEAALTAGQKGAEVYKIKLQELNEQEKTAILEATGNAEKQKAIAEEYRFKRIALQNEITAAEKKAADERIRKDEEEWERKTEQQYAYWEERKRERDRRDEEELKQMLKLIHEEAKLADDLATALLVVERGEIDREERDADKALNDANRKMEARARHDQKIMNEVASAHERAFKQMTGIVNSSLEGWMRGYQSFGATVANIYNDMTMMVINALLKMLEQEIVVHVLGIALKKDEAREKVMADAKSAASGAYSATTAIPIIGPILAPAAAAIAFAATMAFASFQRGGITGGPTMAVLHPNEMVLPANISAMLQSQARGGGGGGAVHLHYQPHVSTFDSRGMAAALREHGNVLAGIIRQEMRNGRLPSP